MAMSSPKSSSESIKLETTNAKTISLDAWTDIEISETHITDCSLNCVNMSANMKNVSEECVQTKKCANNNIIEYSKRSNCANKFLARHEFEFLEAIRLGEFLGREGIDQSQSLDNECFEWRPKNYLLRDSTRSEQKRKSKESNIQSNTYVTHRYLTRLVKSFQESENAEDNYDASVESSRTPGRSCKICSADKRKKSRKPRKERKKSGRSSSCKKSQEVDQIESENGKTLQDKFFEGKHKNDRRWHSIRSRQKSSVKETINRNNTNVSHRYFTRSKSSIMTSEDAGNKNNTIDATKGRQKNCKLKCKDNPNSIENVSAKSPQQTCSKMKINRRNKKKISRKYTKSNQKKLLPSESDNLTTTCTTRTETKFFVKHQYNTRYQRRLSSATSFPGTDIDSETNSVFFNRINQWLVNILDSNDTNNSNTPSAISSSERISSAVPSSFSDSTNENESESIRSNKRRLSLTGDSIQNLKISKKIKLMVGKKWKCPEPNCHYTDRFIDSLMHHDIVCHDPLLLFYCKKCRGQFPRAIYLEEHLKYQDNGYMICNLCTDDFNTNAKLKYHFDEHKISGNKHRCHICKLKFITNHELQKHILDEIHIMKENIPKITIIDRCLSSQKVPFQNAAEKGQKVYRSKINIFKLMDMEKVDKDYHSYKTGIVHQSSYGYSEFENCARMAFENCILFYAKQ